MIIAERWPKSSVEVVITILEGAEECLAGEEASGYTVGSGGVGSWATMALLASCVTVASAAIIDAGIDCLDLAAGGVAALLVTETDSDDAEIVLDPCPSEHADIRALCVVAYMAARDEITELWVCGDLSESRSPPPDAGESARQPVASRVMDQAIRAAVAGHYVLSEAVKEAIPRGP